MGVAVGGIGVGTDVAGAHPIGPSAKLISTVIIESFKIAWRTFCVVIPASSGVCNYYAALAMEFQAPSLFDNLFLREWLPMRIPRSNQSGKI
jgi:hypothetical protein